MKRICVFCGSNPGNDPAYRQAAAAMGRLLGERGLGLVYGGGGVGLMGTVADAALAAGAEVIGVIPEALAIKEVAHGGLSDLRVVPSMHARKALMSQLADAFVALPGGFGTLEELMEVLTWAQLGIHDKPVGLLNVAGYYDGLLRFLGHAATAGLLREQHRELLAVAERPEELLLALANSKPARVTKWLTQEQA